MRRRGVAEQCLCWGLTCRRRKRKKTRRRLIYLICILYILQSHSTLDITRPSKEQRNQKEFGMNLVCWLPDLPVMAAFPEKFTIVSSYYLCLSLSSPPASASYPPSPSIFPRPPPIHPSFETVLCLLDPSIDNNHTHHHHQRFLALFYFFFAVSFYSFFHYYGHYYGPALNVLRT